MICRKKISTKSAVQS